MGGDRRKRLARSIAALVLGGLFAVAAPAAADPPAIPVYPGVDLFEAPALDAQIARAAALFRSGDAAGAEAAVDRLIARHDGVGRLHAIRAAIAASRGDDAQAIASLEAAAARGYRGLALLLASRPLSRLAGDPRVAALAEAAAAAPPADPSAIPAARPVADGVALVGPENTSWDPGQRRLVSRFSFPASLRRLPLFPRPPDGPLGDLARLVAAGLSTGNVGDLYDNRDRGHSTLRFDPNVPVQLSRTVYAAAAQAARLDYGLNTAMAFDAIVFGNSSTALQGPYWRSQARLAMTEPDGPERMWQLYADNAIYVFPEHRDHDPEADGGRGDLFPAYLPYLVVSQGSSGSDKAFLTAIQAILAAFSADTKTFLKVRGLIAPTVQQILRRSMRTAPPGRGYLGPVAHPTVFRGDDVDLAAAIRLAREMQAGEAPPMTTLRVIEEPNAVSGVSFFADGLDERLFDTPAAVARVWRGVEPTRRYVLEAAATDPNGRDVVFHWRVLRGDGARIQIRPSGEAGAVAEIVVPWRTRAPEPSRPDVATSRVDIAVFADNGAHYSAPAIFSIAFPAHQTRVYADGPAGPRIRSVDYRETRETPYADPLIWPRRDWRDDYAYDAAGRLLGWTRTRGGVETRFDAEGRRLDGGRAAAIRYPLAVKARDRRRDVQETLRQ